MPNPSVLGEAQVGGVVLRQLLAVLNERLRKHLHQDARNLQVGHAFFQRDGSPLRDFADLRRVLQHEVFPLSGNGRRSRRPRTRPREGSVSAVLDAKYRDFWPDGLTRESLYQMSVYAVAYSSDVSAPWPPVIVLYPGQIA